MADATGDAVDTFPAHDAFSIERVTVGVALQSERPMLTRTLQQDHVALMRRFSIIINAAAYPGPYASWFPKPPRRLANEDEAARWRVQCLLMNAEVRYGLYLRLLSDWIFKRGKGAPSESWPLPPW